VMTVVVFAFLGSWNDLFSPLIYLHDERMYTLPIGLLTFISQAAAAGRSSGGIPLHLVMALATVMVAPIVIVFFIAQKHFIEGIASAGVKG
jgi:ABC-type glycerol-3-phosphate transport system permease component